VYLKTLTLKGFKSFASTTTLNFEPGITAIVGPNGSGKSNIVDALSWVMGEQGVKSLRGSKMEDVIFAGTSARPPLGRAEVTLTIDNTDQALPIDYTEVTLSRTMFRNGGSEYAINGHVCRLLDVQELLSDTGMGREMHVIVGQGQLDAILNATPEQHRGFIEEAAGVLKHRRRKEKAQRKLEATATNLDRLSDLIAEIRRQLKPLGRQAEVARRAALVQAELRDARARLLADELAQAQQALATDAVAEAEHERLQAAAEAALRDAREQESCAEADAAAAMPRLGEAQEIWYNLTGLRERVTSTLSIAAERVMHATDAGEPVNLRDPDVWEAEAAEMRAAEAALHGDIEAAGAALLEASRAREDAESTAGAAESAYSLALRAAADRREGLAKLTGQVAALRSRLDGGLATDERLRVSLKEAEERTSEALADYQAMETRIASLDVGQMGLDSAFEQAEKKWRSAAEKVEEVHARETEAAKRVAALAARVDALELGLGPDVSVQLAESGAVVGMAGRLSAHVDVEPGWEAAIAAALGPLGEAIVAADLSSARKALSWLKDSNTGRAALLVRGVPESEPGQAPDGLRWAADVVKARHGLAGAVQKALAGVVLVETMADASHIVGAHAGLTAVTRDGDVISVWQARGGAVGKDSQLQAQAALRQAQADLEGARHDVELLRFEMSAAVTQEEEAHDHRDAALAQLHESDAAMGALEEQLSVAKQRAASSQAEAGRLQAALDESARERENDEAALTVLQQRLEAAGTGAEAAVEPDPTARDAALDVARQARESEMEAKLALRTLEERAAALSGRADALMAAAEEERAKRVAAVERAARLRREAEVARCVHTAAEWLAAAVDEAVARAGESRAAAEASRVATQAALAAVRTETRELSAAYDRLVEGAHRDEMARIEQRMRVETLTDKAMAELGLDADTLVAEYGPDLPVPVLKPDAAADDPPETQPYVRAEQQARLRRAEQDLAVLGKVNPLALEEYDAMSERHAFLAEQLEDVKRTRTDLLGIIDEVDTQVQQVFAQAFADVAATFSQVFARLFPGGEGRLVLTESSDALLTGVEVEARPAGKKIKRLSLLSGGERSLVAVAFLLSLFIARPSPFYILDEVEAALDDVNLSRLLEIYEELRQSSQLLIITHQKRTMEVADALYGITMRDDGVSKVVSQRLVDR